MVVLLVTVLFWHADGPKAWRVSAQPVWLPPAGWVDGNHCSVSSAINGPRLARNARRSTPLLRPVSLRGGGGDDNVVREDW